MQQHVLEDSQIENICLPVAGQIGGGKLPCGELRLTYQIPVHQDHIPQVEYTVEIQIPDDLILRNCQRDPDGAGAADRHLCQRRKEKGACPHRADAQIGML